MRSSVQTRQNITPEATDKYIMSLRLFFGFIKRRTFSSCTIQCSCSQRAGSLETGNSATSRSHQCPNCLQPDWLVYECRQTAHARIAQHPKAALAGQQNQVRLFFSLGKHLRDPQSAVGNLLIELQVRNDYVIPAVCELLLGLLQRGNTINGKTLRLEVLGQHRKKSLVVVHNQ